MNQKSQSLSINAIIIAAIALVALVVIISIFTNFSSKTAQNIGSCETKVGICADKTDNNKPVGRCGGSYPVPIIVSGDCENTKPVKNLCCLKIGNE